jgi:hypothetical protein
LISDIYLDGAISEVAIRRSEFAAILKNEGIDGLIVALNRKAYILSGTTARSFQRLLERVRPRPPSAGMRVHADLTK